MHSHGTHMGTAARLLLIPFAGMLAAGCAIGPNTGPGVVRDGGSKGIPTSESAKPEVPALGGVKSDLDWRDCPPATTAQYGVRPDAAIKVQCATMVNRANPATPGGDRVTVPLMRVSRADTPPGAAPLVTVTGADLPAGQFALALANGPSGKALLSKHAIVAVEQRGLADIDCMTRADRTVIADNGLVGRDSDPVERVDRVARAARSAADSCNDTLDDNSLAFTYALAATDIEALRTKWGVEKVAVLGAGSGAEVALSYAAQYANRVGRIIVDSPTPFAGTAKERATTRVRGVEQALETFTRRCTTNPACRGREADPGAVLASVLRKASAGALSGINDAELTQTVMIEIGLATDPSRSRELIAALAAADKGNTGALAAMVRRNSAVQNSDGMQVSRCNNVTGTAGLNEIEGLVDSWPKQYPLTGQTAAISLARCSGWSTASPVSAPTGFAVAPLVFGTGADPVNGSDPAALNKLFLEARTSPTTVSWDGVGYSVLAHSDCAADLVNDYLDPEALSGDRTRACPAG
ncbi:putative hydrolase [Gordonia araii NBRC 100433]|uniref:Putative hydrolase n=1 Tax=Gordonia araii NBRC 100433 TaxID=1073574 RepID=G7H5I3_9ACTN|nr:alpha/beta hydrolase [Gordonia araii]NNG95821.1 alpha/beta hydrolase [Gordonia araii NBRC 100433]GAB11108.1 putative hydrolase [Gordonia araii NBRC 100433]